MARRTIVLGINQCTLAALSMATIAAFVDGPGLGQPVVQALQNLDVGAAAVPGLAIVVMAIMLDRTTTAASERAERQTRGRMSRRTRRIVLGAGAVVVAICIYLSRLYLQLAQFPRRSTSAPPSPTRSTRPPTAWSTTSTRFTTGSRTPSATASSTRCRR